MADDTELEKRAVEELLKEATRARVRAETMGPAGWMKCPLRSTNKRFLLNTLRNSGSQQRRHSRSPSRERQGASEHRSKGTARRTTPPAGPVADGDRADWRSDRHRLEDRDDKQKVWRYRGREAHSKTHTKEAPLEGISSQRSRYLSRDHSDSRSGVSSAQSHPSPRSGHPPKVPRQRSRSPVRDSPRGRARRF